MTYSLNTLNDARGGGAMPRGTASRLTHETVLVLGLARRRVRTGVTGSG